jgi:hypothetical protein
MRLLSNLPVDERKFRAPGANASDPTRKKEVTKAVNFIVYVRCIGSLEMGNFYA